MWCSNLPGQVLDLTVSPQRTQEFWDVLGRDHPHPGGVDSVIVVGEQRPQTNYVGPKGHLRRQSGPRPVGLCQLRHVTKTSARPRSLGIVDESHQNLRSLRPPNLVAGASFIKTTELAQRNGRGLAAIIDHQGPSFCAVMWCATRLSSKPVGSKAPASRRRCRDHPRPERLARPDLQPCHFRELSLSY